MQREEFGQNNNSENIPCMVDVRSITASTKATYQHINNLLLLLLDASFRVRISEFNMSVTKNKSEKNVIHSATISKMFN